MHFRLILPANKSQYRAILHICTLAGATLVVRSISARELAQQLTRRGGKLLPRVLGAVWPPSVAFSTVITSKHQSVSSDMTHLHAHRRNTGQVAHCGPGTGSAPHPARRKTTGACFECCIATINCLLCSFNWHYHSKTSQMRCLLAGDKKRQAFDSIRLGNLPNTVVGAEENY